MRVANAGTLHQLPEVGGTGHLIAVMDELDLKIISLMQIDGRASNSKIAREIGVAEGTVRRRLGRLIKDDVVKVIAVPNLEMLGYTVTALIGLQTSPGKSDSVAEAQQSQIVLLHNQISWQLMHHPSTTLHY